MPTKRTASLAWSLRDALYFREPNDNGMCPKFHYVALTIVAK